MIYLVIMLMVSHIIHVVLYQKILFSVKRRYKHTDNQIRNLSQWVITNDQAISKRLENIQELITGLRDIHSANTPAADVREATSVSMHMQILRKQALEKITADDLQQYHALLMHELQQLDNSIHTIRHKQKRVSQK